MELELLDGRVCLIRANALNIPLEDGSVNCCVTSPPYWGLRDYGTGTWEGGDPKCAHIKPCVADSSKALASSTLVGSTDSQNHQQEASYKDECGLCGAKRIDEQLGLEKTPEEYVSKMVQVFREVKRVLRDDGTLWINLGDSYAGSGKGAWANKDGGQKEVYIPDPDSPQSKLPKVPTGMKPKDLVGIPWMVAFALRADGWYLRQDIIWAKPNPMPESVKDRCTKSHEYIFMLSKSPKYYYDFDAVKEPAKYWGLSGQSESGHKDAQLYNGKHSKADKQRGHGRRHAGFNERWDHMSKQEQGSGFRNKRDVWTVATKPYAEAHFATFPPKLIEPCILAGCPVNGLVLDPFGGSGTTARVAIDHGRRAVLLDINYKDEPGSYLEMAKNRILAPAKPEKKTKQKEGPVQEINLFNWQAV